MKRFWLAYVAVGAVGVMVGGCGGNGTSDTAPTEGFVCGKDGNTYSIEDAARGEHEVEHRGRCDAPMHCGSPTDCFVGDHCMPPPSDWCVPGPTRCNCPGVFEPVCGGDGRNYINGCEAACAGVGIRYEGYCEEPPGDGCVRAGCSDQLCVEEGVDIASTCEWRPVYECYQQAACERQPNGQCSFTPTHELVECLERSGEGMCYDDGDCPPGHYCERFYGWPDDGMGPSRPGECKDDCPVETHIRNFQGECVPKCYGPEQCGDEQHCNASEVCRQDPACPECDVCVGWCVPPAGDCRTNGCEPGWTCDYCQTADGQGEWICLSPLAGACLPPDECHPTGCNGEICASHDMASPCVALPEFTCYQELGVCELQPWGECRWTQTPELDECLSQFDCRSEGCGEGQYCSYCWVSWECLPEGAVC
jgi:hypothetical protein